MLRACPKLFALIIKFSLLFEACIQKTLSFDSRLHTWSLSTSQIFKNVELAECVQLKLEVW